LGETVWPELPTCRSMGSQPLSQMGREAASSAPSAVASSWTMGMFSASLMPRPTLTISCAEPRSTVCARRGRARRGLVRICAGSMVGVKTVIGALLPLSLAAFGAKGSGLHGDKAWPAAGVPIVAVEAALHQLPREDWAVADGDTTSPMSTWPKRRPARRVVAHLVGVRKYHIRGLSFSE
jgi:hypothetical protein